MNNILILFSFMIFLFFINDAIKCDEYDKMLYDHLTHGYNKLVRPVIKNKDSLGVNVDLKLSRLIDIDEKNQEMTTDVWLTQIWYDYRFKWNASNFNGISSFYLPVSSLWTPDLVIYNTVDAKFSLPAQTKAKITSDGRVEWKIPSIIKSSCMIDVEFFPFDIQTCFITLFSISYNIEELYLNYTSNSSDKNSVTTAQDKSDEWDVLNMIAKLKKVSNIYQRDEVFHDISFCFTLRRKSVFYMINLIVPCSSMSSSTILVFMLTTKSGEKITLCVSILLAMTLFCLVLIEIMPATSTVIPFLVKYLIFTICMLSLSISITIYIIQIHHRRPEMCRNLSKKWRNIFLVILPRFLFMKTPYNTESQAKKEKKQRELLKKSMNNIKTLERIYYRSNSLTRRFVLHDTKLVYENEKMNCMNSSSNSKRLINECVNPPSPLFIGLSNLNSKRKLNSSRNNKDDNLQELLLKNIDYLNNITFIMLRDFRSKKIRLEWETLANVLDRLFLVLFSFVLLIGCGFIIFIQTPFLNYEQYTQEKMKICQV